MADQTKIEWTDATWNPVTGCSVVSPGCTNCYAMKLAGTRLKHHPSRAGLTHETKSGPVWNGEVRFNREWLDQPLRWKKPRMIFVCAHGDLFHESVPDEWIDQVFAVMALSPQHTFQVLTKRPERMRGYLSDFRVIRRIYELACDKVIEEHLPVVLLAPDIENPDLAPRFRRIRLGTWPPPNVWLGVSVEDQRRAEERIPVLLDTPAAVRWISAEPLLGQVNLHWISLPGTNGLDALRGEIEELETGAIRKTARLDWVVAGGESGLDARPMHPDWARSLRNQCEAADVPFLFKQWGSFRPCTPKEQASACGAARVADGSGVPAFMLPASKGVSGRTLDGVIHDAFPQAIRIDR